jgi:hypothetical protein
VINQEEIALGFNKLSYIRTLPKFTEEFMGTFLNADLRYYMIIIGDDT